MFWALWMALAFCYDCTKVKNIKVAREQPHKELKFFERNVMIYRWDRVETSHRVGRVVAMFLGILLTATGHVYADSHEGETVPVTKRNHKREIIIVSIDHCPPCKRLARELDKLRQLAGSSVIIRQVYNVHESMERQYHITIRSFPTILIIVDGAVVQMFVGYYPAETLWNMIDKSKLHL